MSFRDEERGSGRTQRMLEAVVAAKAETVFIFAVNDIGVRDILWRLINMIEGATRNQRNELRRPDGRRVLAFVHSYDQERNEQRMRGVRNALAFTDHAVWDRPLPPRPPSPEAPLTEGEILRAKEALRWVGAGCLDTRPRSA